MKTTALLLLFFCLIGTPASAADTRVENLAFESHGVTLAGSIVLPAEPHIRAAQAAVIWPSRQAGKHGRRSRRPVIVTIRCNCAQGAGSKPLAKISGGSGALAGSARNTRRPVATPAAPPSSSK